MQPMYYIGILSEGWESAYRTRLCSRFSERTHPHIISDMYFFYLLPLYDATRTQ